MKRKRKQSAKNFTLRFNFRDAWYSAVVWILVVVASGVFVLPWYYLVLPVLILLITVMYFSRGDKTFSAGLICALFWFFVAAILDFFEIIGPYYSNAELYFSDVRNLLKYPLLLLVPVIYSLVMEGRKQKKFPKKLEEDVVTPVSV